MDRVVRAKAVATPRPRGGLASGLVAPLDALGLVADGTAPRSGVTGAIGPTAYVEAVNRHIAVYDHSGRQLSTRSLEDFTGTRGPADPQVQWDPRAGAGSTPPPRRPGRRRREHGRRHPPDRLRLLTGARSERPGVRLVSLRVRHRRAVGRPGSKDLEADPRLGHDDAHLIFGTNAYGPDGFRTARIFFTTKPGPVALTTCPERPPVPYFGTPANPLTTRRGPLARTPVPANTQDAAPAGAIVSAAIDPATGRGDALPLWHIDYANGHLISDGTPLVSRFAAPDDALQPGSAPLLDTGDGRLSEALPLGAFGRRQPGSARTPDRVAAAAGLVGAGVAGAHAGAAPHVARGGGERDRGRRYIGDERDVPGDPGRSAPGAHARELRGPPTRGPCSAAPGSTPGPGAGGSRSARVTAPGTSRC